MKIISIIIVFAMHSMTCDSANILSFTTFPGFSHYVMIDPIIKNLAKRGHNITAVTYFPQKPPIKNIHDIDMSSLHPIFTNNLPISQVLANWRPLLNTIDFMFKFTRENCELVLNQKAVQDIIKNENNVKYDLVLTEAFGGDCFIAFAHKFNASLVSVATSVALPWINNLIGNPENPAYIPTYFSHSTGRLSLYERITNTISVILTNLGHEYYSNVPTHALLERYFGKLPPLHEIRKKSSLILANTHYSFRHMQPATPNYIEIAGIHLKDPKPLPKEIRDMLDNAPNGTILVSLGSVIRCSTMPTDKVDALVKTFAKLPYQILWKVEDHVPGLPSNVITRKWFPIQDMLDHPKLVLMVMHGGMSTTIEVVNAGVPIVGVPVFADQIGNIDGLVNKGVGIAVDYVDMTEEKFYNAIIKVATDPSYRENMKKLSAIYKDKENTPMETAMFWIEHIIRHKGSMHLQSPAVHLSWYQLMLLDVILVILTIIVLALIVTYLVIKTIKNYLYESKIKKKQA